MGVYNEKASLVSTIVKISMIILIACLVGITNSLAEKETSSIQQEVEHVTNN